MDGRRKPESKGETPQPQADEAELGPTLASLLQDAAFSLGPPNVETPLGQSLVGVCLEERHPTLLGRVRVHLRSGDRMLDAWLPTLQNLAVRRGDQVLLTQPLNGSDPVVMGVIDGLAHRPARTREAAARLELKEDEVLRIEDAKGRPMLEVRTSETGPIVRLLQPNLAVEVDGKLRLSAESIHLEARQGQVELEATDDVLIKGEVIHLN